MFTEKALAEYLFSICRYIRGTDICQQGGIPSNILSRDFTEGRTDFCVIHVSDEISF